MDMFRRGKKERERVELEQRNYEAQLAQQRYDDEQRNRDRAERDAREARQKADEERRHRELVEAQLKQMRDEERRHRSEVEAQMRQRQEAEAKVQLMAEADHRRRQQEQAEMERRQREMEEQAMRESMREHERQQRERKRVAKLRNTSSESLYQLRDLIRQRYQLDVKIWGMRNVLRGNQKIVINLGKEADAILLQIYNTVEQWDEAAFQGHPREWQIASQIKEGITNSNPRWWENNPPWADEPERQRNDHIYF